MMTKPGPVKRTAWTLLHLAMQPRWALPYVRDNLLAGGKEPMELGLPWFSYGAVRWLAQHADPGLRVVEFGSGGSTLFFGDHYGTVTAYEHDPEWLAQLRPVASGRSNLEVNHLPLDMLQDPEQLPAELLKDADLVVIDSVEDETFSLRPKLLRWAESVSHRLPWTIVLDDSWRYSKAISECSAKEVEIFGGLGPGRRGKTETAILHY